MRNVRSYHSVDAGVVHAGVSPVVDADVSFVSSVLAGVVNAGVPPVFLQLFRVCGLLLLILFNTVSADVPQFTHFVVHAGVSPVIDAGVPPVSPSSELHHISERYLQYEQFSTSFTY